MDWVTLGVGFGVGMACGFAIGATAGRSSTVEEMLVKCRDVLGGKLGEDEFISVTVGRYKADGDDDDEEGEPEPVEPTLFGRN